MIPVPEASKYSNEPVPIAVEASGFSVSISIIFNDPNDVPETSKYFKFEQLIRFKFPVGSSDWFNPKFSQPLKSIVCNILLLSSVTSLKNSLPCESTIVRDSIPLKCNAEGFRCANDSISVIVSIPWKSKLLSVLLIRIGDVNS